MSQVFSKVIKFIILIIIINSAFAEVPKVIAINQFISHPALDKVVTGIKAEFNESIFSSLIKIIEVNSHGSINNAIQATQYLYSFEPLTLITIATPAALVAVKNRKDINITLAFAAVSDAKGTGLMAKKNIIGVTESPLIDQLLINTLKIIPATKRIGMIYNPAEVNSNMSLKVVEKFVKQCGLQLMTVAINNSNEAQGAIRKLINKVDFVYLPLDNTVISALEVITKVALAANLPLVSNDPELIKKGILYALGSNYQAMGRQLAKMIIDYKLIKEANNLLNEIRSPASYEAIFNSELALSLGIKLPKNIILLN